MKKLYFLLVIVYVSLSDFYSQGFNTFDNEKSSKAFIENNGQYDGRDWYKTNNIKFAYSHNPFYVFFRPDGLTYRMDKIVRNPERDRSNPNDPKRKNISELIHVNWLGANQNVNIVHENMLDHYYSFAVKDFSNGEVSNIKNVKGYSKIIYQNLYDNIDVEYILHENGGIKYNVILHPGANPNDLKLKYTSAHTNIADENIEITLEDEQLKINTSLGQIIEHKPFTFYDNNNTEINSSYTFVNNELQFVIDNYDNTQKVIIDPWIVSPTFATSTAVWEVETDAAGNVYTIGGETPMELKKYSAAGALLWNYVTPWDTNTVWLGTLATDAGGTSYITSGTTPEIQRVDNAGNMIWHNTTGGGFGQDTEYWTISFNCDKTKLIVGGTKFQGLTDVYAAIFDIDVNTGNVLNDVTFAYTNIFGMSFPPPMPEEVRSISSAKNGKFIYLTHNNVGALNQNFDICPNNDPTFEVSNQYPLGYKCENYLPQTQNGGGLKALTSNDMYFYTHTGNQIHQWDLITGALLNSAPIPGGASNVVAFIGGLVVENSGLSVDDCGNVYAGSKDRVLKFDPNLNLLSTSNVSFNVYDVSVNSNGEVLAVGAQLNNANVNRNGRIESLNMTACAQYAVICCDASFCQEDPICASAAPITLNPATPGGTWSGPGVNPTTGVFSPSVAGQGVHTITYTLACGNESLDITVLPCVPLTGCEETNGDLTVTNGTGPYTWYEMGNVTYQSNDCVACGGTLFFGVCSVLTPCTINGTGWVSQGTGTTYTPTTFPVRVVDVYGDTLIISAAGTLAPCGITTCTPPTLTSVPTHVSCLGGNNGAINLTVTGTSTYSFSWSNGATSEDISGLIAGSYTVTVTDQVDPSCSATLTVTINNGTQPTVVANSSANNVCPGDMITLTGSGASTYTWDNGVVNGTPFAATTTTTYTVTGQDANGCSNTDAVTITVITCTTPNAAFVPSATSICEGDCIDFTNNSTNIPTGSILGWNFPGATPINSTANDPTNVCYATAGTYWVTLIYSDAMLNLIDSTGTAITVTTCTVDPPIADFIASSVTICEGDCINFNDLSTSTAVGGVTSWAWNFGNGQTSTVQNPTNICYASAGNFTVSLTVTDANGTHTETFTNYIETTVCAGPQPVANFSATNTTLCTGDCIGFSDLSTSSAAGGITSWAWNFGNGQTSTLQNPTNICYATAGNYTVTLTVSDANGNNTQTLTNYVVVTVCTTPNASFNVTPSTTICEGDCIGFVNTSTAVPPGAVVGWNFPGATPANSTQNSPNNICYNTAGTYWATLIIVDGITFAVIDSTGVAITVTPCVPPVANFTFGPTGPYCSGDCITFTSNSTFTAPATFLWDFGNGQTNLTQTPGAPICYNSAGTFNVSLTVTDANGSNTQTQTIEIIDCTPPSAGFTMSNTIICEGQCIFFNNTSTNGTFYQWTFEGGNPGASYLPFPGNVCFEDEGDYTITLVAGNAYGSDTITSQVTVNPSPNVTTSEDQLIYSSHEIQISAVSSDPNVSYIWSPTEWLYCPDCAVTTVAPEDTIVYTVTVTNSFGCSDSSNVLIEVIYIEEIGVPSAFSPNGDGHNDVLYVQGTGIKNMVFRVFNRYGQMVFETTDQEFGWDGTFQGKELNPGVFVYYVLYDNSTSEDNILEGNVTLIR
jgi:gliding motility-associated-like protein